MEIKKAVYERKDDAQKHRSHGSDVDRADPSDVGIRGRDVYAEIRNPHDE
jgi:hypothetical protein